MSTSQKILASLMLTAASVSLSIACLATGNTFLGLIAAALAIVAASLSAFALREQR